jgi:hypothetical protein
MPQFTIKSFSGGQSEFDDKGIAGSFKFGKNLDVRKRQDTLSCGQATTSETITSDLILWFVEAGSGNVFGFGDTGKIYKRTAGGTWSVVHTDTGKIKGAGYWYKLFLPNWKGAWNPATTYAANDSVSYEGNYYYSLQNGNLNKNPASEPTWWGIFAPATVSQLYWVAEDSGVDKLRRILPTGTWPTDIEYVGSLTTADWHPMKAGLGYLWIANEKNMAIVDYDGNFTKDESRFNIYPGNMVKAILEHNDTIIVGSAHTSSYVGLGGIWKHIYSQVSYQRRKELPENVNALIETEFLLAQAGTKGNVYSVDFENINPICKIPGGGYSTPGAVLNEQGMAFFGISGENAGVWSYGRINKQAKRILNYEYAINANIIGALTKIGDDILISYSGTSESGVLKVDLNNKAIGVYEALDLKAPVTYAETVVWEAVKITLASEMPTGATIGLEYKIDNGSWKTAYLEGGISAMSSGVEGIFQVEGGGKNFNLRLTLTPSGNNSPEVKQVDVFFN